MKYYYNKLVQMYHDANNFQINYYSESEEFLPRIYLLYNYFNGDETYLDEIEEQYFSEEVDWYCISRYQTLSDDIIREFSIIDKYSFV